ncbi:proline iminopeptidase [Sphaerotilus hippei]|uniref:Proline iminopeptidase n=1 Tax=Sphaerotilus hippei TaxID=744406 RepID=A0A318GZ25_9BURK|nr:prolyl aminopeptidase [Sphaerotilus hippei]PXW95283.1 proline iminopeptidase [Sphaerotilus hippei]
MDSPATLFPPIEPHTQGRLAVDALHTLHWERCGSPGGLPVVFLHGGPGSGSSANSRRFFHPQHYDIVVFDQRGSGRSTPLGEMRGNTTADLVADIERLRQHLGIERWLVFGGSWGSTLALAYAQAHPAACLGLVLRGIWLVEQEGIDWWLYGGRQFFPEAWEAFAGHLPPDERGDLLSAYWQRLSSDDPAICLPAARAWNRYESALLRLRPPEDTAGPTGGDDDTTLGPARMEALYCRHLGFMAPGQLLHDLPRIHHLPVQIVHGRYDLICPVRNAVRLARDWPGARLSIVADAGHTAFEPGITAELVRATEQFRRTGDFRDA